MINYGGKNVVCSVKPTFSLHKIKNDLRNHFLAKKSKGLEKPPPIARLISY